MEPTIYLNNGSYFNFLEPESSSFTIYDIANALSKICRFTGQGDNFYSVAEHSIFVSYLVPEEFAMEALLHDASEAFIGDVSTPLKNLLPDYKVIEANIEREIFSRFNLTYPFPPCIKYADKQAFFLEKEQVMNNFDYSDYLKGVEKPDFQLSFYTHSESKTMFLNRYFALERKRNVYFN